HVGQVQGAAFAQDSEEVEDVLDVIIDAIADVFARTDAAGQLAEPPGHDREGTQGRLEDRVVDMDQQDVVGEGGEASEQLRVPAAGADRHVVVEQHQKPAGGSLIPCHV